MGTTLLAWRMLRMTSKTEDRVLMARADAEQKAWDALARYKFYMAGYWMAAWVKCNQLLDKGSRAANPFRDLVQLARQRRQGK